MKVVVAIDSLKGSLTSLEAGEAIRDGVLNAFPDADVQVRPLADGGEGTVEALVLGMGGELQKIMVTGPQLSPAEREEIAPDVLNACLEAEEPYTTSPMFVAPSSPSPMAQRGQAPLRPVPATTSPASTACW